MNRTHISRAAGSILLASTLLLMPSVAHANSLNTYKRKIGNTKTRRTKSSEITSA